jgi:hypothetical protein
MFERFRFPNIGRLRPGALVALAVAFAPPAAYAGSDYPAGLFENSPVVGPGSSGATGPSNPDAGAAPSADASPDPDSGAPYGVAPPPIAPAPPGTYAPSEAYAPRADDFCAGIAARTFTTLAEVRRAHAQCDRAYRRGPPPPVGYPAAGFRDE